MHPRRGCPTLFANALVELSSLPNPRRAALGAYPSSRHSITSEAYRVSSWSCLKLGTPRKGVVQFAGDAPGGAVRTATIVSFLIAGKQTDLPIQTYPRAFCGGFASASVLGVSSRAYSDSLDSNRRQPPRTPPHSHFATALPHFVRIPYYRTRRPKCMNELMTLQRTFGTLSSKGRLEKLLSDANKPENATNPKKQAELFKEFLRNNAIQPALRRFETQPQLSSLDITSSVRDVETLKLKSDPELMKLYIEALGLEGQTALRVSGRLAAAFRPHVRNVELETASGTRARSEGNNDVQSSLSSSNEARSEEGGAVKIPASHGTSIILTSSPPNSADVKIAPVKFSLEVEAWTWGSIFRKILWTTLYLILTITAISVLLDHQTMPVRGAETIMPGPSTVEPSEVQHRITFSDVQGVDEAKGELEEIVAFLKEPKQFMEIGGKLPKGILLFGPPGTGKTHLARAVAGEAGVPFFHMAASEFDELFVGVGARRVRELFAAAKKMAPCIVFIDELDAVGSKRNSRDQTHARQTLNQLLVELDGFSSSEGVILIAATNTPESLDKALTRPGRFDRHVSVPLPDVRGRMRILEVHSKTVSISRDVDMHIIARGTPGFSGADLANLVNQAALKASKEGAKAIRMGDLEWAKDRIIMGAERRTAVITESSKRLTAYHEGGHTLVAMYSSGAMPLHKVTIIPRQGALGLTVQLPETDKYTHTKRELLARIDVCMGGRAAEELIYGPDEITTGASNDLEKATDIAREMIMSFGMSEKFGPVSLVTEATAGQGGSIMSSLSPEGRKAVEAEVKQMLEASYSRAFNLLKSRIVELHRLVDALVEHETLGLDDIKVVVGGGKIKKWDDDHSGQSGTEKSHVVRIPDNVPPSSAPARI